MPELTEAPATVAPDAAALAARVAELEADRDLLRITADMLAEELAEADAEVDRWRRGAFARLESRRAALDPKPDAEIALAAGQRASIAGSVITIDYGDNQAEARAAFTILANRLCPELVKPAAATKKAN